jgi:hypothetical protein
VTVWIWGCDGDLVRADSIVVIASGPDGLRAECASGRAVRLTGSQGSGALQLALLEEIRRAGADDRLCVVIMPVGGEDSPGWRRECVDELVERVTAGGEGPFRG